MNGTVDGEFAGVIESFQVSKAHLLEDLSLRSVGREVLANERAGLPATIVLVGTSRVTTLHAPTMALGPTVTPGRMNARAPMKA
jgi:hypothetical protein